MLLPLGVQLRLLSENLLLELPNFGFRSRQIRILEPRTLINLLGPRDKLLGLLLQPARGRGGAMKSTTGASRSLGWLWKNTPGWKPRGAAARRAGNDSMAVL